MHSRLRVVAYTNAFLLELTMAGQYKMMIGVMVLIRPSIVSLIALTVIGATTQVT